MKAQEYDLAIIGAGPAGMMAALRASECGANVVLLEKNKIPGIKLSITGKDRCNITNAEPDILKFVANFGKNGKFLLSALHRFGIKDTIDFFHENRLKTKVERGGRIFPEGDKAKDVQELFLRLIKRNEITLLTSCMIQNISQRQDTIEKIILDNAEIKAKNYLISTGGLSYPQTGSTGEGYNWAKQMGHTIVKPEPALTPILVRERWIKEIEGLSLKNVRISIYQNNKKQDDRFGEALFTGLGMSGPIILDMSKSIGRLLARGQTDLFIDFKPALDFNILDKRILRDLEKYKNKSIKNILPEMLPKKLIPVILQLAKIGPGKKGHSITKDERKRLRLFLKQFPLTIRGLLGFNKAIITAGGISLKEIDPRTMRSRIIKNLYFAGEIIDLDGPTGGYNLQVCWSTGYLAGENAAKN
ncbi:MAG: NAD(P)/FAD-dependent oxidoreductase [Deltaproteobacteria bacterium]|nr:NAD(P)/FAD-dependent oxidoreductase [Deltaproteobacteria bacterium]